MTIIVAKDGIMCADSLCTIGSVGYPVAFPKIVRLADGSLLGGAGYAGDCWNAFEWFLAGSPAALPMLIGERGKDNELDLLMMKKDGSIWRSATGLGGFYPMPPFAAIGEHAACIVADAANRMNRSAAEAVQLAIDLVVSIGGPVQVERLEGF